MQILKLTLKRLRRLLNGLLELFAVTSMSPKDFLTKALKYTPFAVLVSFLLKLPVYADEEQWLYINSRQFTDDSMQYLFPFCQEGFQLSVPVTWLPIRSLLWLLYSHLGLINSIRLIGVIQGLLVLISLRVFLRNYAKNFKAAQKIVFVGVLLGTTPFLFVLNRPEQLLFLLFLISANLSAKNISESPLLYKILHIASQILLLISMPAIHPKGNLLSLVALIIFMLQHLKKSRIITTILCSSFLFSLFDATRIWNARTSCPESNFLTQTFKIITLNPTQIDSNFVPMVIGNLLRTPKYIYHLLFLPTSQSNWLSQTNPTPQLLVIFGNLGVLAFTGLIVFQLIKTCGRIIKLRQNQDISNYISLLLIAAFLVLDILQRTKNFYDSYLPALLLTLTIAVSYSGNFKFRKIEGTKILDGLVLINIPALIFTLINVAPNSSQITKEFGDILVKDCKVTKDQIAAGGFVIDPSLTGYFWQSPRFIYSSYLWGWWAQDVEPENIIKRVRPPVIIVRSDVLLLRKSTDVIVGDFVCRNRKTSGP